eukprot:GHVU01123869.1.p2 GENE.GHVU01123869.1~~GHVU01123869.1.p2  ORF type:complete len:132 (-),score=11.78 GHVU01123869.1:223-618(-)
MLLLALVECFYMFGVNRLEGRHLDMCLAVICHSSDFKYLPRIVESVSRQTRPAAQTLFVVSSATDDAALRDAVSYLKSNGVEVEARVGNFTAGPNRDYALTTARHDGRCMGEGCTWGRCTVAGQAWLRKAA